MTLFWQLLLEAGGCQMFEDLSAYCGSFSWHVPW